MRTRLVALIARRVPPMRLSASSADPMVGGVESIATAPPVLQPPHDLGARCRATYRGGASSARLRIVPCKAPAARTTVVRAVRVDEAR